VIGCPIFIPAIWTSTCSLTSEQRSLTLLSRSGWVLNDHVRNCWYVAAWDSELARSQPIAMRVLGERIVLWRAADDTIHALEDRCAHRLAPLSLGRCEGANAGCTTACCFWLDGVVLDWAGQGAAASEGPRLSRCGPAQLGLVWHGRSGAGGIKRSFRQLSATDDGRFTPGHGHLDHAARGTADLRQPARFPAT